MSIVLLIFIRIRKFDCSFRVGTKDLLTAVQLKGKHCRKPHCRNGVVNTFGHCQLVAKFEK